MHLVSQQKWKHIKKGWYKFSKDYLSVVGLVAIFLIFFFAVFASYVTPYPEHSGHFVDFDNAGQAPSLTHLFGTDCMGRDVFTRVIFGLRYSLTSAAVILSLVTPLGTILGLIAGYHKDTWVDVLIMRLTEVFISVPPVVFALAICSVIPPTLINSMMAMSVAWWPWYCRMVYSATSSLRNEFFVQAAEVVGAGKWHILFKEILPNCLGSILTKMTLDVGWAIMATTTLGFLGLGAQPPTPDIGTIIADGAHYMPEFWWLTVFPSLGMVFIILAFNLFGDGVRDLFATEAV